MKKALILLTVFLAIGCGKGDDNPEPAPAPAPAPAAPAPPPPPPSVPGTSCPLPLGGSVSGTFTGQLSDGGQLIVSIATQQTGPVNPYAPYQQPTSILGAGQLFSQRFLWNSPNAQVCVSSTIPGGTAPASGYVQPGGAIFLTMYGQVAAPAQYSPWYPNQSGYIQVSLGGGGMGGYGGGCQAFLTQANRIQGCIMISTSGQPPQMLQSW